VWPPLGEGVVAGRVAEVGLGVGGGALEFVIKEKVAEARHDGPAAADKGVASADKVNVFEIPEQAFTS
jgi:hypothetical protein